MNEAAKVEAETAGAKTAGFTLPCPRCAEHELAVSIRDLSIQCDDCGECIPRSEIEQVIDEGRRLLRWLDAAQDL